MNDLELLGTLDYESMFSVRLCKLLYESMLILYAIIYI